MEDNPNSGRNSGKSQPLEPMLPQAVSTGLKTVWSLQLWKLSHVQGPRKRKQQRPKKKKKNLGEPSWSPSQPWMPRRLAIKTLAAPATFPSMVGPSARFSYSTPAKLEAGPPAGFPQLVLVPSFPFSQGLQSYFPGLTPKYRGKNKVKGKVTQNETCSGWSALLMAPSLSTSPGWHYLLSLLLQPSRQRLKLIEPFQAPKDCLHWLPLVQSFFTIILAFLALCLCPESISLLSWPWQWARNTGAAMDRAEAD